jgi:hypothetical protein
MPVCKTVGEIQRGGSYQGSHDLSRQAQTVEKGALLRWAQVPRSNTSFSRLASGTFLTGLKDRLFR